MRRILRACLLRHNKPIIGWANAHTSEITCSICHIYIVSREDINELLKIPRLGRYWEIHTLHDFYLAYYHRFFSLWEALLGSSADLDNLESLFDRSCEALLVDTREPTWYCKDNPLHLVRSISFHRLDNRGRHSDEVLYPKLRVTYEAPARTGSLICGAQDTGWVSFRPKEREGHPTRTISGSD